MAYDVKSVNTTLCYLRRGEDYLMLHRVKKQNDVNQDKWIGVGGKFEADESPEDCLLREVREETGLNLTRYQYRGIVTFVSERCRANKVAYGLILPFPDIKSPLSALYIFMF